MAVNERIKQLIEQAELPLLDVDGKCKYGDTYFSKEKFAELIVQDTANLMRQEWYDRNNAPAVEGESPRDIGFRVGAKVEIVKLIHKVKKHFGVEE